MEIAFFTVADSNNLNYATMLKNSLAKFHPDIPFIIYGDKEIKEANDQHIFYRATPYFARKLLGEYKLVIKIDADSIVTGDLSHVFTAPYDVAVVYNWNRVDPKTYGEIGLATIQPQWYFNNGLVAMRSKEFVEHWWQLCTSRHFEVMPMREQGFLNILAHYCRYNVHCLDDSDMWHGLISKGEWLKVKVDGDKIIVPAGEDHFPPKDKVIKVIHWAGGAGGVKMNYKTAFQEDVIKRLDYLVS